MIHRIPELDDSDALADRLYTCAADTAERAAVSLLVSLPVPVYSLSDFRTRYLAEDPSIDWATVRWTRLAADLDVDSDFVPTTPRERAAITLACSLATVTPINLGDALAHLDRQLLHDVLEEVTG